MNYSFAIVVYRSFDHNFFLQYWSPDYKFFAKGRNDDDTKIIGVFLL